MSTAKFDIMHGDATTRLGEYFSVNTFDACLCDPPYGCTAFQNRQATEAWEKEDVPTDSLWGGVFHVLRPGAMLMAATFGRTYHRIATSIERAGFEIKDPYWWAYSGANATGVTEGWRLRPAVEPYVVARKPRAPRGLKGKFNVQRIDGHLSTNVAMSVAYVDPLAGRNTFGFFLCGKAKPSERVKGSTHPTLKPLPLTEHLAALLHQKGAKKILVPFAGEGSEMIGCLRAGWEHVVGIEREEKYVKVARKRVPHFAEGEEA